MAKKTAKKQKPWMEFYNLRLNEEDLAHLRWVLNCECDMQQQMMDSPPAKGTSRDQALEDWVIARDMKVFAMRIIQMIDKVCPAIARRAKKGGK